MSAADRWSPSTDRLHADAPAPPPAQESPKRPWRVNRMDVKIGDVYYLEPGAFTGIPGGWVRVDRVLHDNLDQQGVAYVEVTVVYLDFPYPYPRKLGGPSIEYHLRRHTRHP